MRTCAALREGRRQRVGMLLPPPQRHPASRRQLLSHRRCRCTAAGTGRAKKEGGGGKYTWGAALDDGEGEGGQVLDPNDPNYDSGGLTFHVVSSSLDAW